MGRKNRNRRKAKKGPTPPKKTQGPVSIAGVPEILGGEFDSSNSDRKKYLKLIEQAPKRDKKIRILFSTEASYLRTGFSTYLREVFIRLHATGKYELAELGSYGAHPEQNPLAQQIPWKYYPNLPANPVEQQEFNKDYRENQFGKWKMNYVLADFRPDIVMLHRDHWMDHFVLKNQMRNNFLAYWMPTVDGYPQKWEWLNDYAQLDGLFAYSYFGKKVLEEQPKTPLGKHLRSKPLKVIDVCQPGCNLNIFKPYDKNHAHQVFGVPPHVRFVGTVMRNQPRKLFDRIIQSFAELKQNFPKETKNHKLLLHTSIPDVGWDIPEAIARAGIGADTFFTYLCDKCQNVFVSQWIGSPTNCPICKGKHTCHTPNTQRGVSEEHLAMIYNLMDIYVQGSIAEGDGMPVNEAKACGIPCLVSDYSALHEKAKNGGAMPIANETIYTESDTMQWRSLFDRKDLVRKMITLIRNEDQRRKLALEARQCAEDHYDWDLTALKWMAHIDNAPIKDRSTTWDAKGEIKEYTNDAHPEDGTEEEFLLWAYQNILCREGVDPEGMKYWKGAMLGGHITRAQLVQHFKRLIDEENKVKVLNTKTANDFETDPIKKVANIIKEVENGQ